MEANRPRGSLVIELLLKYRRIVVVAIHAGLIVLANYLAFLLRFDFTVPDAKLWLWLVTLPLLVAVRGVLFVPFRLYEGLWRYTGIWDLRNIIAGVVSSTLVFFAMVRWGLGLTEYPRVIYIIDCLLLIFFMGGIRLARRIYRELGHLQREKRVLIFGAGDAGEMIVRDMKNNPFYDYEPIGFVDDDPAKVGKAIHGVRVLGTREALQSIIASERPDEVLVAIPRAEPATIRGVVRALEPYKVPIKTLPSLRDVLDGKLTVSQIRNLSVEDLLARRAVRLDPARLRHLVTGRRVLVTGAGGSIGSELCRQVAALDPSVLVLLERYENGLYAVANDLEGRAGAALVCPAIGDVTDAGRVSALLAEHRPEIIFHAAAHKHVPLMQLNPCEAVKNNVLGTHTLAQAAERYGVERFILISTDKAVNPTSVMGATKRVAEMVVQSMTSWSQTCFVAVRFGNVLGSNGSVVPRFLEQIEAGGPVTLTHPEMRRFFMLIPEAVQLVLHAAALGHAGTVYVLEMGEQVRIVDMARNLIRLAGFVPEDEIPITFVGVRPGEKLFEELVGEDETLEPCGVENLRRVRPRRLPAPPIFEKRLVELEQLALQGDVKSVVEVLRDVVPTFRPAAPDGTRP
jgi:FlaA1/EpsC-like NDP-sugar epimerase